MIESNSYLVEGTLASLLVSLVCWWTEASAHSHSMQLTYDLQFGIYLHERIRAIFDLTDIF